MALHGHRPNFDDAHHATNQARRQHGNHRPAGGRNESAWDCTLEGDAGDVAGVGDKYTWGIAGPSLRLTEYEYDGGGIGDSTLTKQTNYPEPGVSGSARVTQNWYDWRDRLVATKGGVQSSEGTGVQRMVYYYTYDNASRVTSITTYDADNVTLTTTNGVPVAPSSSLRRAKQECFYDDQGREYRRKTFSVDMSDGDLGNALSAIGR